MSNPGIQRAAVYTGLNLAVSTLYYFGVKERFIPGAILNKQAAVIGLSVLTQASRGLFINYFDRNDDFELKLSLFIHGAAIAVLGGGSYLCGVPLKTTIVATLIIGLTHAQITDYVIHKDDPSSEPYNLNQTYTRPSFPKHLESPVAEARQVLSKMKDGPLKASASVTIFLTEALIDNAESVVHRAKNLFNDQPAQRVALLCGLAEITDSALLITQAYKTADAIEDDDYLKAACMIRIAYAAKRLAPDRSSYDEYLDHCPRSNPEIERWVKAFHKHSGDYAPRLIHKPENHHMTRWTYHIQEGNLEEARKATREDFWNLYWRIEALCDIAKRAHFMHS
ncbi:MAG: hypothetical protein KFB93_05700 [Simkaniaceae bacterium]|nr:MAG: hypothetical protein KFB93_05700 [Simkaniaceae bacterium]